MERAKGSCGVAVIVANGASRLNAAAATDGVNLLRDDSNIFDPFEKTFVGKRWS